MRFWKLAALGGVGLFLKKVVDGANEAAEERKRAQREEEKRKSTKCDFSDGISIDEFRNIVKQSVRYMKRVTIFPINDPVVYGTVRTNSGLGTFNFTIDFNDYGHLTGKYWLQTDNEDSSVPEKVAENISKLIRFFPKGFEQSQKTSKGVEYGNSNTTYTDSYGNEAKHFGEMWQEMFQEMGRQPWQEMWQEMEVVTKDAKKKSFKRKIKIKNFICWTFFIILLGISVFFIYQYKERQKNINITVASTEVVGSDYGEIVEKLEEAGFTNVHVEPEYDLKIENIEDEGRISEIEINGDNEFDDSSQYPYDARIDIIFHALKNIEVPVSARTAQEMNYAELEAMLKDAGFVNISIERKYDLITGWITKDGTVDEITIEGDADFSENAAYRPNAEIIIVYHTFKKNED